MEIWKSRKKIIEIGMGKFYKEGNYGAFFSVTKTWWIFYITISKPTLDYLKTT